MIVEEQIEIRFSITVPSASKNVALDKIHAKGLNKNNVGPRISEDGFLPSRCKRTHETATELFKKFTLNLSYDYVIVCTIQSKLKSQM